MNDDKLFLVTQPVSFHTTLANQLLDSWRDREYRQEFVRERVRSSVALQIRALREQREMTQRKLGEAIGKRQEWISVVEDPEYGKMSVSTLLQFAAAFDTDLEIKFRPFSRTLRELPRQDETYFDVPSFEEELPQLKTAAEQDWIGQEIAEWNFLPPSGEKSNRTQQEDSTARRPMNQNQPGKLLEFKQPA